MRNDFYVGIYEDRYLAHSKGPWRVHKYLQKIGQKYIYARNKVGIAANNAYNKLTGSKMTLSQRRAKRRVARRNAGKLITGTLKRTGAQIKNKAYATPYLAKAYKDKAGFAVSDVKKAINNAKKKRLDERNYKAGMAAGRERVAAKPKNKNTVTTTVKKTSNVRPQTNVKMTNTAKYIKNQNREKEKINKKLEELRKEREAYHIHTDRNYQSIVSDYIAKGMSPRDANEKANKEGWYTKSRDGKRMQQLDEQIAKLEAEKKRKFHN